MRASWRSVLFKELTELYQHRDLLWLLIVKELKIKYKGTALGFLWSLLNPVLMMLVYSVVFSVIVRFQMSRYPIFLLSGLLPWTAFSGAITSATLSVVLNGHLVRRVRFPREFLPITAAAAALFNLVPSLAILVVLALGFRQPLGWPLLTLPLLLVLQAMITVGIALILSAVTVYFRDLEYLVGIGTTVWFFATPVIYPLSIFAGHRLEAILLLNPMTWLITSYQRIWHENQWPDPYQLLALGLVGLSVWIAGAVTFKRLERRFAEEV
jgi:lipopolysaccharide transport system permease protein